MLSLHLIAASLFIFLPQCEVPFSSVQFIRDAAVRISTAAKQRDKCHSQVLHLFKVNMIEER